LRLTWAIPCLKTRKKKGREGGREEGKKEKKEGRKEAGWWLTPINYSYLGG
jgi:hypothetical protein